ncbi:MAG: YCF48-related protein [Melioribacteraceae bacterium]
MTKIFHISKLIVTLVIFLYTISYSQNRWQSINPQPTGFDLYKIDKDTYGNLWAFGDFGTIIKSTDNGNSWNHLLINEYNALYDAAIVNNEIWAVGANGLILHSENNGSTWLTQNSNTTKHLVKIQFVDEKNGWVMAQDSVILRTEDGGASWEIININSRWTQCDMAFLNSKNGFLLSGYFSPGIDWIEAYSEGALLKTTDGGKSWNLFTTGTINYKTIFFLNDKTGFISAIDYLKGNMILKTTDAGINWDTTKTNNSWSKLFFRDSNNGIGFSSHYIGKTTNGGIDWVLLDLIEVPSQVSRLISIFSKDENVIVAGTEGNILRSSNFGNDWINLRKSLSIYYGHLQGITFIDSLNGFVYGQQWGDFPQADPLLIHTKDGGKTWIKEQSPDTSGFTIMKINADVIWATSRSSLYKSINKGINWIKMFTNHETDLIRDFSFCGEEKMGLIAGRNFYLSTNGGEDWTTHKYSDGMFMKQLLMINEKRWIVLGHNGLNEPCYITNDSGENWILWDRKFTAMNFINDKIGYGIDSVIYKTIDGGYNWNVVSSSMKNNTYWVSSLYFLNENIGWMQSGNAAYFTNDGGNNMG